MVVAASILFKALLEIWLIGSKTETVPGESNIVFISIINIGLFLSNKLARKHSARRLQVKKLVTVQPILWLSHNCRLKQGRSRVRVRIRTSIPIPCFIFLTTVTTD